MTQMMAKKERVSTIRGLLMKSKQQIEMALPQHMNADRLLRVAMTSIQATPKLLDCTPESLLGSVIESAQLGLEPDGVTGLAYLVPYGSKCTLIPGYKGLLTLARRSGEVTTIYAHAVMENDFFHYELGLHPKLEHKPLLTGDRGEITHLYAVAILTKGGHHFEVMSKSKVDAIRKRSKAGQSGPWVTDYEEMARKTVLRRVCKYLTLSPELDRAVAIDERVAIGLPVEPVDAVLDVEVEKPSALDDLADLIDGGEVIDPEPEKPKRKPRKLSAAKVKAYEKRISGQQEVFPGDVYDAIKESFGAPLAELDQAYEPKLEALLEKEGV